MLQWHCAIQKIQLNAADLLSASTESFYIFVKLKLCRAPHEGRFKFHRRELIAQHCIVNAVLSPYLLALGFVVSLI